MTADSEIFSTPPTTPGPSKIMEIQPSISRRNSRPISLHIDQNAADWTSDVVLEENSPEFKKATQHLIPPTGTNDEATVPEKAAHLKAMASPCFVHSQLDKNLSLSGWLLEKQNQTIGDVGVSKSLRRNDRESQPEVKLNGQASISPPASSSSSAMSNYEDDDDYAGSLTKQLAETAVGVREMSKQLGRARVRSNIQNVLIITKARDNRLIKLTREIALYLMLKPRNGHPRGLVVYVDNQLRHSRRFDAEGIERDHPELFVPFPRRRTSSSNSLCSMSSSSGHNGDFYLKDDGQLRYWTSDMCSNSPHLFDFVVTLGGDGTVLFTSWLFQKIVPPVLPFALGSLGFLTNFDFADHQAVMDSAIDSGIRVNLRMRFTCTVYRAVPQEKGKGRKAVKNGETGEIMMKNIEKGGWEALEGGWNGGFSMTDGGRCKDKEIMCFTTRPAETFEVLNDLVVDRGPSPYVSLLELFGDEHHMTTVQADGLTVSTPTGSTAYSLSAGGSLVHPEIPALLITPICPHTLSFRPMLLPDSMELRICVPFNSRSTAWASFDGRGRVELKQGDHIKVTASKYPFPTVCADKQSTDWFHAISRTLKWNERERQKSFVVVEEGPSKVKKRSKRGRTVSEQPVKAPSPEPVDETLEDEEEDEVSDEEDEEDKFDIDDSSPEAAQAKAVNNARNRQTEDNEKFTRTSRERRATPTLEGRTFARATKSRSRSRTSGIRSGIDSPGRFAGPQPHHPHISSRHIGGMQSPDFASSSTSSLRDSQEGTRDDIYSSPKAVLSNRSRIPKDREAEMDSIKTPTAGDLVNGRRGHYRVASSEHHPHRAFAVWGHDESDSNASDSDA